MRGRVLQFVILFTLVCVSHAAAQSETGTADPSAPLKPLPSGALLVPGAMPSASDRVMAVPETSRIVQGTYHNDYFGLTFRLPAGWLQKYDGPPPSDSGAYVLAELVPSDREENARRGTIVITAQDLFFTLRPGRDPMAVIRDASERLESFYEVERQPVEVTLAGRKFARFDYQSPAAGLHWYVLATEIRCHIVKFVFTSRDTALLDSIVDTMNAMTIAGDDTTPLCVADYAATYRVDPAIDDHKFNPIPVRVVIDKQGRVKHVHVISAFADQARIVTDTVLQWRFKPSESEVETGILFGAPKTRGRNATAAATAN